MNDLAPWLEWKERCALEKCSEPAAGVLRNFFQTRLLGYIRGLDHNFELPKDSNYAGALFEFKHAHGQRRDGKTYKQALFSPDVSQDMVDYATVTGRAALLTRDIAREITCASRSQFAHAELSLDDCVDENNTETKYGDLLQGCVPDAAFTAWLNQVAQVAAKEAVLLFDQCTERERWVLGARASGVELTDPALHSSTGLKKTALYKAKGQLDERVTQHLRREFPEESPEDFALMVRATMEALVCLASDNIGGTHTAESL
jgi:hypothetical protein